MLALGSGLAVAELLAALVGRRAAGGVPSPVEAVGSTVIDLAPVWLKDWAIATFGTSNKTVLIGVVLVVLLIAAAVVGRVAVRGDRATAATVTAAVGALGAVAVVGRPGATVVDLIPTLAAVAVAIGVFAVAPAEERVLTGAGGRSAEALEAGPPAPGPAMSMGPDRRRVLVGGGALAVGAIATGGLGRWIRRRAEVGADRAEFVLPRPDDPAGALPTGIQPDVDGLTRFVTPNDDFFRIDTALTVPQLRREDWRLRVHGMVDRELELGFDDLLDRPMVERYVTLSCVSNQVGGSLVGTARWQGIRLGDLLREAGVRPGADQLVSRSIDGWTCGTPTAAVLDGRDALVVVGMNGEPLPARHGYPVRLVVPGLFGYVSATKWVTELELTTWDAFDAYWVPRGWAKEGPVKTMSRIDRPRGGQRLDAGEVVLGGVAWAVHRGVSAVEISVDDGPWTEAELAPTVGDDTWRLWSARWGATPGEHTVRVRAVDAGGEIQPEGPRAVAPDGAEGYHRVRVTVT